MDLATMVGAVVGLLVITTAIFLGGGAGAFFNVPAMFITMGGTFCATLVHFPLGEVMKIVSVVKRTFTVNVPSLLRRSSRASRSSPALRSATACWPLKMP